MNPNSPVIEIQTLVRRYGKHDAVNGLSLTVSPGKCYGFFGRNGAGKTTTIKCLLNLLRPDSGTVRVFGLAPHKDEVAIKSRLAYVPDMVAFYPWMTVGDTLGYLASFRTRWNRDLEADLLRRFQLDSTKKTSSLSKGQRTQLALIGAICPEPELLVLDEPTSGLDRVTAREIDDLLLKVKEKGKTTMVIVTHDSGGARRVGDRVAVLDHGEILGLGTIQELENSQNELVRALVSEEVSYAH